MNGPERVRIEVVIDVEEWAYVEAFGQWAQQVELDIEALENTGCGCCVNIYTIETTAADAAALNERVGVRYLPV